MGLRHGPKVRTLKAIIPFRNQRPSGLHNDPVKDTEALSVAPRAIAAFTVILSRTGRAHQGLMSLKSADDLHNGSAEQAK